MKRNKAKLVGEYHYVMPYNIHFPFKDNFIKQILNYNNKLMEIMLYNIENGIINIIEQNSFEGSSDGATRDKISLGNLFMSLIFLFGLPIYKKIRALM